MKSNRTLKSALALIVSMLLAIGYMPLAASAETNTLPSNATMAVLQAAINSAASGDIIQISNNIDFTDYVNIPAGKTITIESSSGTIRTLKETGSSRSHFWVYGTLILKNITIDGNKTVGRIWVGSTGKLTMEAGATIQNCNGGVYLDSGAYKTGRPNKNGQYLLRLVQRQRSQYRL
ncbi:MAG: hypothetical protein FWF44_04590 [Defluviitaleaceae bacterium]|nr:hypothetical protein [Defluviitaleaceae bacterium]